jgi:hypothetical protein
MKALMIAGVAMMAAGAAVQAEQPKPKPGRAEVVRPAPPVQSAPWFLSQRRSTPDTSMPGSTAPVNPVVGRPTYASQQEQYYAAELRRCETFGEASERLACKNSVRNKFGEM